MKTSAASARYLEITARDKNATTRARNKDDDANIKLQRTTVDLNQKAGKDTNAADAEQGAWSATTTGLLTAAGICTAVIPQPFGAIVGGLLAAIAIVIMLVEASEQKTKRDSIAETSHTAQDLKVTTDATTTNVKQMDDRIKTAADDLRTHVQQQIDNMRREYEARHQKD